MPSPLRASRARRLIVVVPCLLAAACATAPRRAASVPVPTVTVAQRTRALQYVLAWRDTAGVVDLFAPNAIVVTVRGDTLRDPNAAARYLLAPRTAGALSSVTSVEEGHLERCTDGVVQVGSYFVRDERAKDEFVDAEVGSYAARWVPTDGEPRLAALVLRAGQYTGHRSFGIACPLAAARLARRRVELFVTPIGTESRSTTRQMSSTLLARGWAADPDPTLRKAVLQLPDGTNRRRHDGGLLLPSAGARIRVLGPLSLEGQYQLRAAEGIANGSNRTDSSYVAETFEANETSALLSARWRLFRGGVGVSRVSTHWEQGHASWGRDAYGHPYLRLPAERRSAQTSALGTVLQGGLVVGVSSHVLGEITVRSRTGARSTVPAIGKYPAWTSTHDMTSLGVSFGVAF